MDHNSTPPLAADLSKTPGTSPVSCKAAYNEANSQASLPPKSCLQPIPPPLRSAQMIQPQPCNFRCDCDRALHRQRKKKSAPRRAQLLHMLHISIDQFLSLPRIGLSDLSKLNQIYAPQLQPRCFQQFEVSLRWATQIQRFEMVVFRPRNQPRYIFLPIGPTLSKPRRKRSGARWHKSPFKNRTKSTAHDPLLPDAVFCDLATINDPSHPALRISR